MLSALVKDLLDVPGVDVIATRDATLPASSAGAFFVPVGAGSDPWSLWQHLTDATDALWPIAPETGGTLEALSAIAPATGRTLLNSRPQALRVAASKRATTCLLRASGVDAVPTLPVVDGTKDLPDAAEGWVIKPDDGAGAEDTILCRSRRDVEDWLAKRPDRTRFVVQPYVPGEAVSLSMLCHDGMGELICCNKQDVVLEGDRFRYRGGVVGGAEARRNAFMPVAARVAAVLPGLWGYVGVDLIDRPDGPVVLEINPRLTTSYAGIRDATGCNVAERVLRLLEDDTVAVPPPDAVTPRQISLGDHG